MHRFKNRFLRAAITVVASVSTWSAAQSQAKTDTGPKPEDWYKTSDRSSLILRDVMIDADEGKLDAMLPLALTLLSGWGRAEGPHPQAALYWLTAAADRGEHKALSYLAVIYSMGEALPRDENKANTYLEAFAAKTGVPLKDEKCGDDVACNRYRKLISTYSSMFLEYPREARRDGLGGEFHAELDLATLKVKVTGEKHLNVFEPALRKVIEDAAKNIPQPQGLVQRRKSVTLDFDLRVGN